MSQPDKTGLFDPGLDDQAERIAAHLFAEPYEKGDFGRRWERFMFPRSRCYLDEALLQRVLFTKVAWEHREKFLDEPWRRVLPELLARQRVQKTLVKEGITTLRDLSEAAQSGRLLKTRGFGRGSQIDVESALRGIGIDPTKQP